MPSTSNPNSHPARLNLPVAPQAVARSRFAAEEKVPPALSPAEALAGLDAIVARGETIDMVELAGPGDPLATLELTVATLDLARQRHPGLALSIATLGIGGDQQIQALAEHGIRHLTLLVDAVTPEIVTRLFAWIRPARKTVALARAAEILLSEQAATIAACKRVGVAVTIRTTVYLGFNDNHVEEIAKQMAALGVEAMIVVPGLPGTDDHGPLAGPDRALMNTVRGLAAKHLAVIEAPAAEEGDMVRPTDLDAATLASIVPRPSPERPNVAVVSSNGMEVDLHLGQATRILVYGPREDGLVSLLGTRSLPAAGSGGTRWERLAEMLPDCFALLAASAGDNPRTVLRNHGIPMLITDGGIEGAVDVLYGGGRKKSKSRSS